MKVKLKEPVTYYRFIKDALNHNSPGVSWSQTSASELQLFMLLMILIVKLCGTKN